MSPYPTIPGFDIERVLGRGGMAVVYAATDPALGRRVAIKVVSAQGEDAARHVRRLEQEARGLANLQHPHIVELHSFGRTEDGSLYYVMPLFEGGDLTRWPKPMPEERLKPLLAQLLAALAEAHAAGIVHRDIKPENILFDRHERPLLADFGAAFVRGATRLTEHGTTIGSSHYMSPEQARGMDVDARSDLYGLGVLAFEYLVGRYPFDGEDDLSIALAKLEQPVPTLPASLSHWQAFFNRALAARPDDRFRDAEAMRLALVALGNPASAAVVERPPLRWRRPALIAGALAVAALLFAYLASPRGVTPEMIEAAIEAGRLAPPAAPNAVDLLRSIDPDDADAATLAHLRSRTLMALAARTRVSLDDPEAVRTWSNAVVDLDAKNDPSARALAKELSERIGQALDDAIARHDREAARRPIALVGAWAHAPDELRTRAAQAGQIKVLGDRFEDTPGAPLVLALPATQDRPALAVMTKPVDTELYSRFLEASGRTGPSCPQAPPSVQACVEYDDATAFAAWLSEEAGNRYRVPSRDELAQLAKQVEPGEARAWTSTCREQRTAQPQNVARRTWSEVRQVFGRSRLSPSVHVRCVGQFTVALDGRGDAIETRSEAAPDVAVVLVREMPRQIP